MATRTPKTTKSKTKTRSRAKITIEDVIPKKSIKIKKIGEDKYKGICIIYNDRGTVKPCFIDGMADHIEQWYQDNKYKYEVLDKIDTRIYNYEERLNGVMDKELSVFISKIKEVIKKHK